MHAGQHPRVCSSRLRASRSSSIECATTSRSYHSSHRGHPAQVDWDKWVDEDEEEEGNPAADAGFDLSAFQNFGGMGGGMGGMGGMGGGGMADLMAGAKSGGCRPVGGVHCYVAAGTWRAGRSAGHRSGGFVPSEVDARSPWYPGAGMGGGMGGFGGDMSDDEEGEPTACYQGRVNSLQLLVYLAALPASLHAACPLPCALPVYANRFFPPLT